MPTAEPAADRAGSDTQIRLLIPVLFFFSGACGLIYEVVWAKMLTVLFGTTLFAVSVVLSSFMAGLAVGSFFFGRRIDRIGRPLRLFACLEAGIGLFALAFPWILAGLGQIVASLHPEEAGFLTLSLGRFALCFLTLLIPTALMGATLPVVVRFAVREWATVGRGVGSLYAINTAGAVCGVLLVTFVLLEWLGLRGSSQVAAAVNLAIAILAWVAGGGRMASKRDQAKPTAAVSADGATLTAAAPGPNDDVADDSLPNLTIRLVLVGFAVSGFAALGYEVAWMRLLTVAFTANSHYEFSVILTAFLLGLALGGFAASRLIDAQRNLLILFGGIQILIGLFGLLSVPIFTALPGFIEAVKGARTWIGFEVGVFAVAVLFMLVPTVLMGATFPLVGRIHTRRLARLGRGIGDVNAINSLGAMSGSFVTGFLLIPYLGTEWSTKSLAGLNLIVGVAAIGFHPALGAARRGQAVAVVAALVAGLLFFGPRDVLQEVSRANLAASRLVYYEEGAAGVVTVSEAEDGFRKLMVNGGGQVPSDYASVQMFRLLGHLPLLLHPDPQDALVIAFGGGIALGSVSQHPLRRIDCVEIVPEVLGAAGGHFAEFNHHILDSLVATNVQITIDDGRNFLFTRDRKYDVITGDATHPTTTDSWVLYTREFYQLCKDHLSADGIMAQWLPLHGLTVENYKTILRTFQTVFPHASLWLTNDYTLILGTQQKLRLDWRLLEESLTHAKVRRSLEEVDLGDPYALLSCFLLDERGLAEYVGDGPINTDDHPLISFRRSTSFRRTGWRVLQDVGSRRVAVADHLDKLPQADGVEILSRLHTFQQGRERMLEADIFRMQKRFEPALQAYVKARASNPDDRTADYFVGYFGEKMAVEYRRYLSVRPGDAEMRWRLGNLFARIGREREAQRTFERIIEMEPRYLKAYLSLSYLHALNGDRDRALTLFNEAEAAAANTPAARKSLKAALAKIDQAAARAEPAQVWTE